MDTIARFMTGDVCSHLVYSLSDLSNPSSHGIRSCTASGLGDPSMQYLAGGRRGFVLDVALN
jgi:hypothetical protein